MRQTKVFRHEPLMRDLIPEGEEFPLGEDFTDNMKEEDFLWKEKPKDFPDLLSELQVVRHFYRLSRLNYHIEEGIIPLGSCTMKYNPVFLEDLVEKSKFIKLHPEYPVEDIYPLLELLYDFQEALLSLTGGDGVFLGLSAGAHAEWCSLMVFRKYWEERDLLDKKKKILIPDSAHGTNPASCKMAGLEPVSIKTTKEGIIDKKDFLSKLDDGVAGMMVTLPNTLGVMEEDIEEISQALQEVGALLYMDGANFNALMDNFSMKEWRISSLHLNLHKTFSTPHGGGGPGGAVLIVEEKLKDYLPYPILEKEKGRIFLKKPPKSIGKVRSFFPHLPQLLWSYAYIRLQGEEGLKKVSRKAREKAQFLREKLQKYLSLASSYPSWHEVVFTEKNLEKRGLSTYHLAKALLEKGFYAPTIYFPTVVKGAIMIEPTETEPYEELEAFSKAVEKILEEDPSYIKDAPYYTPVRKIEEVEANRNPRLSWKDV